jgi:hypothetical protein
MTSIGMGAPAYLRARFARLEARFTRERLNQMLDSVDPTPAIEGDENDDEQPTPAGPHLCAALNCPNTTKSFTFYCGDCQPITLAPWGLP